MGSFEKECERLAQIEIFKSTADAYFVFDHTIKLLFLIDTGACRSLLPSKRFTAELPSRDNLKGISGKPLSVQGKLTVELDFNFDVSLKHEFVVADIPETYGILGCDFFEINKLSLCSVSSQLIHVPSKSFIKIIKTQNNKRSLGKLLNKLIPNQPCFNVVSQQNKKRALTPPEIDCWKVVEKYPSLLCEPSYNHPPKHSFSLDIELKDESVSLYQPPRRVPASEYKAINENFHKLQLSGVVIKQSSPFASPVSVIKKRNGSYRFCVDYRRLNAQTKDLNFPLPRIDHLQFLLTSDHNWFSTLDLKSAYYSLPLTKNASEKAAIITHSGVFRPLRCPFGLKNAPAKFSELVASVIEGLESNTFVYLDDFLIFSKTLEDHRKHLENLLSRLKSFGFFFEPRQMFFGKKRGTISWL